MSKNIGWLSVIVFVMIAIAYLSFIYDEYERDKQRDKCAYCKQGLHR